MAAGEYRWELLSPFPLDLLPPNIRDRAAVTNRRLSGVIDLAVGEDRVIEFSMPAAVVWGVVDCGGALAGLNLQRRTDQDGMVRWKHVLEKMCELSGAFAIEHVPAGDYLLTVRWQSGFNEWGFVSREYTLLRVQELGLEREGPRAGIDHSVHRDHVPLLRMNGTIGQNQL